MPAYPPPAVAPPKWRRHEWMSSGRRYMTTPTLVQFVTWRRRALVHIDMHGVAYAQGFGFGWTIHGGAR